MSANICAARTSYVKHAFHSKTFVKRTFNSITLTNYDNACKKAKNVRSACLTKLRKTTFLGINLYIYQNKNYENNKAFYHPNPSPSPFFHR